jgi:hypothetical protein
MNDITHLLGFYFPPEFVREVNPFYQGVIDYGRRLYGPKIENDRYRLSGQVDLIYHPTSSEVGGRMQKHKQRNVFVMSVADRTIENTSPIVCLTGPLMGMAACNYLYHGLYLQIFAYLWQIKFEERETVLRLQVMNGDYPVTLPFRPKFVHQLLQHYRENFYQDPTEPIIEEKPKPQLIQATLL